MELGLKGTSRVCRGRHRDVGIVEFGLQREGALLWWQFVEECERITSLTHSAADSKFAVICVCLRVRQCGS